MDNFVLKLLDEAVIQQVRHIKSVEKEIDHWKAQKDSSFSQQRVQRWEEQKTIHENRMEQCLRVSRLVKEEDTKRA